MSRSEKLTVNLNVVDLGKVDVLVEEGFYSNRTDFIKTAVRNHLKDHEQDVENYITETQSAVGITYFNQADLLRKREKNERLKVNFVGLFWLANDVDPELAREVFASINVSGVFKADKKLKDALADRIETKQH